jgi:hypothetical protein
MFGFLIKNEARRDAARLKLLVDQCATKYCGRTPDEACAKLRSELGENGVYRSSHELSFTFPQTPYFHMSYDLFQAEAGLKCLIVAGRGKYAGFMLTDLNGSRHSSVSDGLTQRATAGAKMLAKMLERDHDISDFTKIIGTRRY